MTVSCPLYKHYYKKITYLQLHFKEVFNFSRAVLIVVILYTYAVKPVLTDTYS